MSDPQDDETTRKRIADDVWCRTCDTVHIAYIPVTTFRCADCGFGQWAEDLAESHASAFPSHVVYSLVHEVEPPMTADPVRPQETLRERIAQAIHDSACDWDDFTTIVSHRGVYLAFADAVLPIVEEETAEIEKLRLECAIEERRNAADLAALRDKVKALADTIDALYGLTVLGTRMAEISRELRALVEEPQGGER